MKKKKNPGPEDTKCPECKTGVLFDFTSPLQQLLGVKQVMCDQCGTRWSFRGNFEDLNHDAE